VRVLLIGSYPPPGGVGVLVKRCERKLKGGGRSVAVIDPARFTKAALYAALLAARGVRARLCRGGSPRLKETRGGD
jgi:hypothetical protein